VEQTTAFSTAPSENTISSIFSPSTPASFTILGSSEIPNVSTAPTQAVAEATIEQAAVDKLAAAEQAAADKDAAMWANFYAMKQKYEEKFAAEEKIAALDQFNANKLQYEKNLAEKAAAEQAAEQAAIEKAAADTLAITNQAAELFARKLAETAQRQREDVAAYLEFVKTDPAEIAKREAREAQYTQWGKENEAVLFRKLNPIPYVPDESQPTPSGGGNVFEQAWDEFTSWF
jgi:hypothetical protein